MKYEIPGNKVLELETIILDLNGTLTEHGKLVNGVRKRIQKLKKKGFAIYIFSGNRRKNVDAIARKLGLEFTETKNSKAKEKEIRMLKPKKCVAIGNSRIDVGMFKKSGLRIATLQAEGIHTGIIKYVDIIVPSINDALDLLLEEDSFASSMRG